MKHRQSPFISTLATQGRVLEPEFEKDRAERRHKLAEVLRGESGIWQRVQHKDFASSAKASSASHAADYRRAGFWKDVEAQLVRLAGENSALVARVRSHHRGR